MSLGSKDDYAIPTIAHVVHRNQLSAILFLYVLL